MALKVRSFEWPNTEYSCVDCDAVGDLHIIESVRGPEGVVMDSIILCRHHLQQLVGLIGFAL
jgi:hypothetical protein